MLEIVDLTFAASRHGAGRGPLRLTVRPGELLLLAGPSGCGKSALLQTLAGRLPASSGEVRWQGHAFDGPRRARDARFGLLDDRQRLAPDDLALRAGLRLAAGLHRVPSTRAEELLERWELGDAASVPLSLLPGGFEERLRLALLELAQPQVVLLDHPLAHLDPRGRELFAAWVDRLRDRQGVALWAGSVSEQGLAPVDRVVRLDPDGRCPEGSVPASARAPR